MSVTTLMPLSLKGGDIQILPLSFCSADQIADIFLGFVNFHIKGLTCGLEVFKIMGKDFRVDTAGDIYTNIHVHPWITIPVLNYILNCKGTPVKGEWVPLRELPSGKDWYRLFGQRCEKPMKKIADSYTDLFADLVDIFNGQSVDNHYQSDVALVLHPLSLVPLLICYWRAEEGMTSDLNLFFDASAEDNLGIDGIYALCTGITRMFEKLALRHGSVPG